MAAINSPGTQPARRATFSQGWHWLLRAADQIAHRPAMYLPAVVWLLVIGSLQWILPGINAFLSGMLAPLSIAPLLLTYARHHQQLETNGFTALELVFRRETLLPLLRLGFYLMLVVLALSQLSGMALAKILPAELQNALSEQDLQVLLTQPKDTILLLLLLTVLPMATLGLFAWFSVPLVLFHQGRIPHVLWASMRACISNWRALLALNTMLIIVVMGGFILLVVIGLVSSAISNTFGNALNLILILVGSLYLQMSLTGAQYLAFESVFPSDQNNDLAPTDNNHPADKDHTDGSANNTQPSQQENNNDYWQA